MKNNSQLLMPREKMLKFGISALTDVELLALFLRTGTRGKDVLTLAKEMLENFGSLYGLLTSEYEQFSGVHGIGVAKFAQLKGIAELARRYYNVLMNPLMILVKIIKLRWIHILSYDQMVSRKINNQTTRCANSIF
ncbi:UPF0758 domain-containing protein, partial [Escherichia coli]|uniref:UPF0758 domain-containing protein n=1 Tax=Escherichia coli TaxID=562 RepID=UPI002DBA1EAF